MVSSTWLIGRKKDETSINSFGSFDNFGQREWMNLKVNVLLFIWMVSESEYRNKIYKI